MKTYTLYRALGLGCVLLSGCSGHNVELDNSAAGSSGVTGRIDAIILNRASDPIASQLTADDTRLYWSTWGANVQSCLKADCASTVLPYAGKASISEPEGLPRVSTSAGRVFWRSSEPNNTILSCSITGCVGSPTKIFRDGKVVQGLISDADYAYWASDIDLYRCKASGCGATPELVANGQIQAPSVAGEYAYWLSYGANGGSIQRSPKDGSRAPSTLVPESADAIAFTVNADTLFWENRNFQILSCSRADCSGTPSVVVDNSDSSKNDLIADDTRVYWRNDANLVQSCPLSGCTEPVTISSDEVQAFTVDSNFVYWTDVNPARTFLGLNLHRLPKSAISAMGG